MGADSLANLATTPYRKLINRYIFSIIPNDVKLLEERIISSDRRHLSRGN